VKDKPIDLFRVRWDEDAANANIARLGRADEYGRRFVGQGELCEEFERRFGALVGAAEPPLLLNSCTSALDLALHLIGVRAGDEVVTSPVTCFATTAPLIWRGAIPIWCDVDPLTGNADPRDVLNKVTPRTKAILVVDWAGRACPYDQLHLASIPVIEDAAHGPLIGYQGQSTAINGGNYVCYSHQAIKFLTLGDGGTLITPANQTERARLLRWYGLNRRSKVDFRCEQDIAEVGFKHQSNDIAAAIGLANLPGTERAVALARLNAEYYTRALANLPGVTVPPFDPGAAYWIYSILVDDRPAFIAHMTAREIAVSPVHRRTDAHSAIAAVGQWRGPSTGVDYYDAQQCAVPNGWWITDQERERVAGAIIDWAYQPRAEVA
jgi:dTDP-4-amino-4,6-dideoxygalactose transaminase